MGKKKRKPAITRAQLTGSLVAFGLVEVVTVGYFLTSAIH